MMKIIFFEVEPYEKDFFSKELTSHELVFYPETLNSANKDLIVDADIVVVFIGSRVTEDVITNAKHLKAVVTQSTGTDHITVSVPVLNVPHYGVNTVAEHTFALMLALSRNMVASIERTRQGNFSCEGLTGFDLAGKTLGVIGLGNIGCRVAEIGNAFHMNVIGYNRSPKDVPQVTQVPLNNLLEQSNIITIHTPLTPETTHLINRENMKHVKKGAYLINTARGGIVETEALVQLLQNNTLAGAALDVLEEEQTIKEERHLLTREYIELSSVKTVLLNHVLLGFPNVIITPHNAFNSNEALLEINTKTAENIRSITK